MVEQLEDRIYVETKTEKSGKSRQKVMGYVVRDSWYGPVSR